MAHFYEWLGWFFILTSLLIGIVIVLEKRDPEKTIAWLLVLVFLPIVGFLLYLLFGRNVRKELALRTKKEISFTRLDEVHSSRFEGISHPAITRLIALGYNAFGAPVTHHNRIDLFFEGKDFFHKLFEEMEKATHHIHIAFFIIRHDHIGERLKEILLRKRKEGVEVRIIYDDVGSVWLSRRYKKELREAGVELYPFLPVTFPVIGRKLNYRYHRKIVIIDGKVGYLGGFNIGREYQGESRRLGHWRDTHVRLEGESVYSLQLLYLMDYEFVSKKKLDGWEYFPQVSSKEVENLPIQIISGGPDSHLPTILHTYLIMITNAKERIWIATPYLIPDEATLMALKMASLSGVDVRILIPDKPDHLFVYYATSSYLEELMEVGIQIYKYKEGFMHSKVLLCDHEIVSIGTANLDIRSFYLNFEVNALIYKEKIVSQVTAQFERDFTVSDKINLASYRKRAWGRQFTESIARLFSPIM